MAKPEEQDEEKPASAGRRENTSWCLCGKCVIMPTDKECVCCRQFDGVNSILSDGAAHCISLHQRFAPVYLLPDVLRSVLVLLHDVQSSIIEEPISNRSVLYSSFITLIHQTCSPGHNMGRQGLMPPRT